MPELRLLVAQDYLAHRRLMSHAFGRGAVVEPSKEPAAPPDVTLGFWEGGALLSALTICPFTVYWPGSRGGQLPLGGIAGVATYAEHRSGGYVARLLDESLVRMREAGQVVSALYPFAWSFYRQYGWDAVGEKRTLTLPLRELPMGTHAARCLEDEAAQEAVSALYDQGARHYRGAFTAQTRRWPGPLEHTLQKTTYAYVVEGGYLLWRYEEVGDVREYIACTPEAELALLALLRALGMQVRRASVTLPSDETLTVRFNHNDREVKAHPVFSGRVVDFPALVAQLQSAAPEGRVTVGISDPHAPWNEGIWALDVVGGEVLCRAVREHPQVELDIQALSQAVWGEPSLGQLRRAGRLRIHDEAGFAQLSALFPPHPVMCWNGF